MAMMKQLLFVALVVLIVAGKAPVSLAFFLLQLTQILTLIPLPFHFSIVSFSMVEAAQPYTTYPPRILRRIREAAEAMDYPKHN